MSGKDEVYFNGIEALEQLSETVDEELNPYVGQFVSLLAKKMNAKGYKDKICSVLTTLETNGVSFFLVDVFRGSVLVKKLRRKYRLMCQCIFKFVGFIYIFLFEKMYILFGFD